MHGKVLKISISKKRGTKKTNVSYADLKKNFGIVGDVHAGHNTHRQVSLLAIESILKMKQKGANVGPGDFAENITTERIDLGLLKIGDIFKIGPDVILEISQLGKTCHDRCEIYKLVGDCVMPREGVFCRVIQGGKISENDIITIARRSRK